MLRWQSTSDFLKSAEIGPPSGSPKTKEPIMFVKRLEEEGGQLVADGPP